MKNRLLQIYCGLLVLIFLFPPIQSGSYSKGWDFIFTYNANYNINYPLMLIEILIVTLICGAVYLNKN